MERRSLSENYVKYLLCKDPETKVEVVQRRIYRLGLLPPSEAEIELLSEYLKDAQPRNFFPKTSRHRPTVEFLKLEGIYQLFHPNELVIEALRIMQKPRVREAVEAWVVASEDYRAASKFLQTVFGVPYHPKAIEAYCWFCFQHELLVRREIASTLKSYHARWGRTEDVMRDPRYIAAGYPPGHVSMLAVRMVMGQPVTASDRNAVIRSGLATSDILIATVLGDPTLKPLEREALIQSLSKSAETAANVTSAEDDENMAQFLLQHGNVEAQGIEEVTGGRHNVDVVVGEEDDTYRPEAGDDDDLDLPEPL